MLGSCSRSTRIVVALLAGLPVLGLLRAGEEAGTPHAECALFGPERRRFVPQPDREAAFSTITGEVARSLSAVKSADRRAASLPPLDQMGLIDRHIFTALRDANIAPAGKSDDYTFLRRVSLDLTGRPPAVEKVLAFAADPSPNKRARLAGELLATPEWVDRWTMFFGDLFKNTDRNTQVVRYLEGRNAFYEWIRKALSENRSYDRVARELITATGDNSYEQGELNWVVGGFVTGSPGTGQDLFDQMAANTAETFLGLSHMNCVLCHNGRGHLDSLSLWGKTAARYEAWQFASFFSRTSLRRVRVGATANPYYWTVADNVNYRVDYPLNTTTGNRPERRPVGSERNVAPVYAFSGRSPDRGQNYRVALAQEITADRQFARAAVNYIWREFFGLGLVEPVNQFDPARLDPDNPPPAPWTLQPSNARLLNALADEFIKAGFDLKWLMLQIVNSEAYQLSARYEGEWNPSWARLYARKLVRRLWGEEIHAAIAQTSGVPPNYNVRGLGSVRWAMQLPEPKGLPGGAADLFLDSFLRGDRDEEARRSDGSSSQALSLMNDSFVLTRTRANTPLLSRALSQGDEQLVATLFLAVLSRPPSETEKAAALAALKEGNRSQKAEDLLWALYNKVDFIYNY